MSPRKKKKTAEQKVADNCLLIMSDHYKAPMYRNNVGKGTTPDGRYIEFGLCPGSSDYIGYLPSKITCDMVGKTVAIFVGLETKAPGGKPEPEQVNFTEQLNAKGGIGVIVDNPDNLIPLIEEQLRNIREGEL